MKNTQLLGFMTFLIISVIFRCINDFLLILAKEPIKTLRCSVRTVHWPTAVLGSAQPHLHLSGTALVRQCAIVDAL